jgi:hypothetical protein
MSAVGLAVRFEGSSHDSYDDGHSELVLKLVLWDASGSTDWLPSAPSTPGFFPFLGRCVRLVDGAEKRVVLEIAPAGVPTGDAAPPLAPPR